MGKKALQYSLFEKAILIADDLDAASVLAQKNPRKWVTIRDKSEGVYRVICLPRTRKDGVNYWLWGYDAGIGKPAWRATKLPIQ